MRKMLIGIHDKNCSGRAVTYVIKHHANSTNLDITFVHVFPNLPAMYWDDGHLLNAKERQERKRVIDKWSGNERDYIEPIIQGAMNELIKKGFPKERVHMKFVVGSADVADSLLDEVKNGKIDTLTIGRCGIADGKHLVMGSIVSKLIHKAPNGLAICIVQ